MSAVSLGQLLSQTTALSRKHIQAIAIFALVTGMIIDLLIFVLIVSVRTFGIADVRPFLWIFIMTICIFFFFCGIYYFLLGCGEMPPKALRHAVRLLLPLMGVNIWSVLRSFAWIPLLGLIPAIILGPRFFLSSLILIQEHKGIRESVRESYRRTKGYWWKIFGNTLIVPFCMWLGLLFMFRFTFFLSTMTGSLYSLVITLHVATQFILAYGIIYLARLGLSILQHPHKNLYTSSGSKKVM